MDIKAEIKGIQYKPHNTPILDELTIQNFDINTCPASCLLSSDKYKFSLSKWVSPKRTRSYPFERVYNTLGFTKRITRGAGKACALAVDGNRLDRCASSGGGFADS